MTLVIIAIIAALLYMLAYSSRRRFGVLGLGLAAGTVLARTIGTDTTVYIQQHNLPVQPLTYETTAAILLTLLPALVLLLGGPAYAKKKQARTGAVLFAALATLLIMAQLSSHLSVSDEYLRQALDTTAQFQGYITAVGIVIAVIDALLFKPPKEPAPAK